MYRSMDLEVTYTYFRVCFRPLAYLGSSLEDTQLIWRTKY
jgi:hypothetical protein